MSEWRTVRLGDVCDKITDGTHHSPANHPTGDYKYITAKNIKPWGLDLTDITYIDATTHREIYARCDVKKNDILYIKDGATTGRAALNTLDEEFSLLSSVGVLRTGLKIKPKYLLYALQAPHVLKPMLADVAGVAITRLTLKKLKDAVVPLAPIEQQDGIVAEIEKQFSRLDEAVAGLKRVKANLKRYTKAMIESLTNVSAFPSQESRTISEIAISLDNLRQPVNKTERAKRPGTIPYLGANGQTGWIDEHIFDEELVLVVEDETFVGRTAPFSYYFAGKCWVNNHTHVLRARTDVVIAKYLNLALSYYPFIPLTTGSTGRRKLTKAALMNAPISVPPLPEQHRIVAEVDRLLSITREVDAEVETNLKRGASLRAAILSKSFGWSSGDLD